MKKTQLIFYIFIIGFLLNLVWENVQAPLYAGYSSFWSHFMLCFWASIVDALVIVLLYGGFAIWYRDFFWLKFLNWRSGAVLVALGAAIAIGFERWALHNDVWSYTDDMPTLFLSTGLSPLLQMMLLPLLTFLISKRLINLSY